MSSNIILGGYSTSRAKVIDFAQGVFKNNIIWDGIIGQKEGARPEAIFNPGGG